MGRRSQARERKSQLKHLSTTINLLLKIKFTFIRSFKLQQICCWQKGGRRRRRLNKWCPRNGATKTEQGWSRDDLADQGGAVVPDGVTEHKEIRPETHD